MSNKDRYAYLDDRRMASLRRPTSKYLMHGVHKGWRLGSSLNKVLTERGFDIHNLPGPGQLKDLVWFKLQVVPLLTDYDIKYHETLTGDLGAMKQAEFESDTIGGNIDFWDIGWLGIFVWDSNEEKELMNVIVKPHPIVNQHQALRQLFTTLDIEVPDPDINSVPTE